MPRETIDNQFCNAVRRMENRANVSAWVILDKAGAYVGRVVISHGASKVEAIAWLPGFLKHDDARHYGWARGAGYCKPDAAMGGAQFYTQTGEQKTLTDDGHHWHRQIEDAGFTVIQAV